MSARLATALLMMATGLSLAAAQVPNSAMPGREREQVLGNPMMTRTPTVPPPVVTVPRPHRTCRVRGSKRRVRC